MAQQLTNFIRCTLNTGISAVDTSIVVDAASSPWNTPPDPAGETQTLTLTDDINTPTKLEIITYTGRTGTGPYTLTGVTREAENSATHPAAIFSAGAVITGEATAGTVTPGDHATAANPHSGSAASGANSDITSITGLTTDLAVTHGGTGKSATTAYAVQCGGTTATGPLQDIASVGTAGQVLTSNGAGALPTMQDAGGGGAWNLIQTQTAGTAVSSIDFTSGLDSTYAYYIFVGQNIDSAGGVYLAMRASDDAGSTWKAGGADYTWFMGEKTVGTASETYASNAGADSILMANKGHTTGTKTSFVVQCFNPSAAADTQISYELFGTTAGTNLYHVSGSGASLATTTVQGVRFFGLYGATFTGTISLYGVTK